jgi:hypothetical protein
MSSISAVAGDTAAWATQAAQTAGHAAKRVDRDGDHDANKPAAVPVAPKDVGVTAKMVNIQA